MRQTFRRRSRFVESLKFALGSSS